MDGGEVAKSGTFPPHISRSWGGKYPPHLRASWGGSAAGENFGFWHPPWWGGSIKFQHFPPPMGGGVPKFRVKKRRRRKFWGFSPHPWGGTEIFGKCFPPPSESIVGGSFWDLAPWGGVGISWGGEVKKCFPPTHGGEIDNLALTLWGRIFDHKYQILDHS